MELISRSRRQVIDLRRRSGATGIRNECPLGLESQCFQYYHQAWQKRRGCWRECVLLFARNHVGRRSPALLQPKVGTVTPGQNDDARNIRRHRPDSRT